MRRDAVGGAGRRVAHVDPEDLPETGREVLRAVARVAGVAAVPESHVEHPVRPEGEAAPVMVRVRLRLLEDHALARGVGLIRPARLDREPGDDAPARRVAGPVHVQVPVPAEGRVEGEPEQSLLDVALVGRGREVEEHGRRSDRRVIPEDADHPALFRHEEPAGSVPGVRERHRAVEAERWEGRHEPDREVPRPIGRLVGRQLPQREGEAQQQQGRGHRDHGAGRAPHPGESRRQCQLG